MKIRPVGAELFHADGRTDGQTDIRKEGWAERRIYLTKLIFAFRNFANAPKNMFPSPININSTFINTQIQNTNFALISYRLFTRST